MPGPGAGLVFRCVEIDMPRDLDALVGDLDLLDEVTELLFRLRDEGPEVDWDLSRAPETVPPGQISEWQNRERSGRIDPRVEALASLRQQLEDAWPKLERIAARYRGPTNDQVWWCQGRLIQLHGNPVAAMCRWGCPGCCEGGMKFVALVRDKVHAECDALRVLAAARGAGPAAVGELAAEERKRIYDAAGALLKNAKKFLKALPAKTLADVASRSGLSLNAVKKISVPLQRAGEVRNSAREGYVRARDGAGT